MLLKVSPALSFSSHGDGQNPSFGSSFGAQFGPSLACFVKAGRGAGRDGGVVAMAAKESNSRPLAGVLFEPFEEVKKELKLVPSMPQDSLARQKYAGDCEAAINEQIKCGSCYLFHIC